MMNWQTILILVISGLLLVGYVVLGVLLHRSRKREEELEADIRKWKAVAAEWKDGVDRFLALEKNHALSNEEALKKLHENFDNWRPVDLSGDE